MEQIVIENIPISFTRKNIKNINVRIVEPNGEVRVSAPNYLSMSKIEKFIASRKNWILNAQADVIQRSANNQNRMDKLFDISSTKDEKEIKALKKIYENELLERAKPIFQKWQNETGVVPEKIVVRWTKSVWGTCDKKQKRIMINGMLVFCGLTLASVRKPDQVHWIHLRGQNGIENKCWKILLGALSLS